jgi:hypothetical protein
MNDFKQQYETEIQQLRNQLNLYQSEKLFLNDKKDELLKANEILLHRNELLQQENKQFQVSRYSETFHNDLIIY